MKKLILFFLIFLAGLSQTNAVFYFGNCTWYVAQKKEVNWSGNANEWLKNAAAKGYATGQTPKENSIVVFDVGEYGHVAIVEKVIDGKDFFVISEKNWKGLNKLSIRKIKNSDPSILGFIY